MNKPKMSLTPMAAVVLALLSCSAGVAQAGEEETPLSLTLSHSIKRDNNFSRNEAKQAETVNSTSVRLGFDKAYGRQTYRGGAQWSTVRYAKLDQLNNQAKDVNGSISSGIASNWTVTAGGNYSENLNPIQNNLASSRVVRNIRKYADANLAVQYGNGGTWALVGTQDYNKLRYSEAAYTYQNANQRSTGLKVLYYSTDLLYYGLGGRQVRTHYPTNRGDEVITDQNVDFSVSWQVTGVSGLDATLSRRNSSYKSDKDRKLTGWTGSLGWQYTPRGLLSYGLNMSRTTGADRQANTYVDQKGAKLGTSDQVDNTITTSYSLSTQLRATGKLSFGAAYSLVQYDVDNRFDTNVAILRSSASSYNSVYHATSLNGTYDVSRGVRLGCATQRYSQTPDQSRPRYKGQSYDCYASVTFD